MLPTCFYDNLCVIELLFHGPCCSWVVRMALVISSAVPQCWTLWLMASGSQFHLWESVTLTRSRKSPTCYSSDCDHAMYFLCLASESHYPAWIVSRLLLVWQRCQFRLGIYLRKEFTNWTSKIAIEGGGETNEEERLDTEKSGMYISETYEWKM